MHYHRNLPHIQPTEAIFFITTRLAGSLPKVVIEMLKEEHERELKRLERIAPDEIDLDKAKSNQQKRYFAQFDSYLDKPQNGPYWLSNSEVAGVVVEALLFRAQEQYDLIAYTIMSNHIHFVIDTRVKGKTDRPLYRILQSFKSNTALKANAILNRSGEFWYSESYDHVVRDDDELKRIINYTLQNPVKAGLVENWQDWPNSFVNEEYL